MSRLNFRSVGAGLTGAQLAEGTTAYQADSHGVTYRIFGKIRDLQRGRALHPRRCFKTFRVSPGGHSLIPVGPPQGSATLRAAEAEAEADLEEVLRHRDYEPVLVPQQTNLLPTPSTTTQQQAVGRPMRAAPERTVADMRAQCEAEHPDHPQARVTSALAQLRAAVRDEVAAAAPPKPDPVDEDSVQELVDRIVRRAQYEALKVMLSALAGWIEGARENHEARQHRNESTGDECWTQFHPDDIRHMINDAARELGLPEPWTEK